MSAKLKIGNRSNILIKSLTHHKNILSIKFQIAHAIKNIITRFDILFFLYIKIKSVMIAMVSIIVISCGIGKDREIQVLRVD